MFSRTNASVLRSKKTRLDRRVVPPGNFQTTDAANGNNFHVIVVPEKSQKAAARQLYSKVLHIFHAPQWSLASGYYSWLR